MKTHPIIDYPYRWVPMLVVALVLVAAQVAIMSVYTGADYVPAVIDGIATIGWLMALGYLAWFVVGVVSIFQTEVIILVTGILIWIAGSFMVNDIMTRIVGIPYIAFSSVVWHSDLGRDHTLVSFDCCQRRCAESRTGKRVGNASIG